MVSNISSALNAYQEALGRVSNKLTPIENASSALPQEGFKDMVKEGLSAAITASQQGEAMTLKGIAGKADIQDVVLAVSNAEVALNTVVAVRDSAIKAYQQIMQMPI